MSVANDYSFKPRQNAGQSSTWNHPALSQLLRYQFRAKIAKAARSFRSPRKMILSILALVLGLVWLGQAIAGVLLRSAADPAKLAVWIPFSLLLYTVFHFVKISCKAPVEPFEWTPAETQALKSSPLTRKHLVVYRLRSYLTSVIAKATCFTLVMIPDLNQLVAGLVGMVCGLAVVDLVRIYLEVLMFGLKKLERILFRSVVLTIALGFLGVAFMTTLQQDGFSASVNTPAALGFVQNFYATLMDMTGNPVGKVIVAPFAMIGDVILTKQLDGMFFGRLVLIVGAIAIAVGGLFRLDSFLTRRSRQTEVEHCRAIALHQKKTGSATLERARSSAVPRRGYGAGVIAWYQMQGAIHYRSTLATALLVPTLLCCLPLLSKQSPILTLMNLIGGMVFYSFLLLPSALMLDFRRDVRRLAVWKAMPMTPLAITIGQLAVPVLLTSLFQLVVLIVSVVVGPVSWQAAAMAWPLLIPMNVLIFGLENLIFMIHPIRRNQEGIEVFLRTILTFTAKGILFAIGAAIVLAWAFVTAKLSHRFANPQLANELMFGVGVWIMVATMAATSVHFVAKLFNRLDPSQDLPPSS